MTLLIPTFPAFVPVSHLVFHSTGPATLRRRSSFVRPSTDRFRLHPSTSTPTAKATAPPPDPLQRPSSQPADTPQPLSLPLSLALLNLTTVLWGTQHSVIKLALSDTNPSTLNFLRFLLAALISVPALPKLPPPSKLFSHPAFRHGIELSAYLFAGYALQSAALLTTSASRSAFLLYLNVKLVPLFARVLYGRAIAPAAWASAALALVGTGLLTYDGAPPSLGDAFSVAAAAASALFILRMEAASRIEVSAPALNAVTLSSVAVLTGVWTIGDIIIDIMNGASSTQLLHAITPGSNTAWGAVAYLAIITTALCNLLQTVGQRAVPAERAAVVFALDPVYAAVFAWLLLGESLGTQGLAGAGMIMAAAVLSGFADRPKSKAVAVAKAEDESRQVSVDRGLSGREFAQVEFKSKGVER